MKILYISDSRIPGEKANSIQVVKTCEAFAKKSCEVTLLVPDRESKRDPEEVWSYYGVKTPFEIRWLRTLDLRIIRPKEKPSKFGLWFFLSTGTFGMSVIKFLSKHRDYDVIYTRHEPTVFAIKKISRVKDLPPVVYEAHNYSDSRARLVRGCDKMVTITRALADLYSKKTRVPVLVAPDAVDLESFDLGITKEQARKKLNLKEKKIVTYTGQPFPWKGVHTLIEAAKDIDATVLLVGGEERHLKSLRAKAPHNVGFVGQVPPTRVPLYLAASDVLVLPNTKDRVSREYTSPLKLFEYMASGRPIVASDLPSLREVINDDSAFFFEPENPTSLVEAIKEALSKEGEKRAKKAKERVMEYTWDKRVKKIIGFLTALK